MNFSTAFVLAMLIMSSSLLVDVQAQGGAGGIGGLIPGGIGGLLPGGIGGLTGGLGSLIPGLGGLGGLIPGLGGSTGGSSKTAQKAPAQKRSAEPDDAT